MQNPITALVASLLLTQLATCCAAKEFALKHFGICATHPDDWKKSRCEDRNGKYILSFGLPEVWSDLEKSNISNAVAITAYRRENVRSLQDLLELDLQRLDDILVSREELNSQEGEKQFQSFTKINGLEYKSQSIYRFRNNVGYVLTFTATEGTYDTNLPKFKAFVDTIELSAPVLEPVFTDDMNHLDRARTLYKLGPTQFDPAKTAV